MNGLAVHARQGNRLCYQPIQSLLCDGAEPNAVIDGFLALHPFSTLYIADLNLLSANGDNTQLITYLLKQYPHIQFWIDQGVLYEDDHQFPHNWKQVIGTESLTDSIYTRVVSSKTDLILSLDFSESLIGSNQILNNPNQWPQQVIVMTLSKVGTNTGPDWAQLKKIRQLAKHSQIIAAGGIRNISDLKRLSEMGIQSALVASSLHTGQLSADDIQILSEIVCNPQLTTQIQSKKNRHYSTKP